MHPILERAPFEPEISLVSVEGLRDEGGHSGTAFRVEDTEGRRYKLRVCASPRRAAELEAIGRSLDWLCPAFVRRRGPYLLCGLLEDHRPLTRHELLDRAGRIGALAARLHTTGRTSNFAAPIARLRAALQTIGRFGLDLSIVALRGELPPGILLAIGAKAVRRLVRHGAPCELELADVHKSNFMLRAADDDLRYVDEEGIGLAPRGLSLATLLKTANGSETLDAYREGYAELGDADWIVPSYVEWLLLQDAVRRVAHKLRSGRRPEKLPAEIDEIRAMAEQPGVHLDWRFPKDAIRKQRRAERQAARAAARLAELGGTEGADGGSGSKP